MNYSVLFPEARNVHLIKDVGMIAYKLNNNYNILSNVICYNNDCYNYLNNEVKGLKIKFLKKKYNKDILDGIAYLKHNSKQIDVLQLFHVTLRSVFYGYVYKYFNPLGRVFLKLDCTEDLVEKIKNLKGIKLKLFTLFFNKVDIVGVEQKNLVDKIKEVLKNNKNKVEYIPNGIDFKNKNYDNLKIEEKENVILNVGRIGSKEKRTDLVLNAFKDISDKNPNWKLVLVGPIEDDFYEYIEKFLKSNKHLKDKIIIKGAIYDRNKLYQEYKKAKIYCCFSEYESFGISILEAASFGDIIVSTDVGIAKEIVDGSFGQIVDINNYEDIILKLNNIIFNLTEEKYIKSHEFCKKNFNWDSIVEKLYKRIE